MDDFEVGRVFEGSYPPEAAEWCDAHGCVLEDVEGSAPAWRIAEMPPEVAYAPPDPAPSREELAAAVAELGDLLAAQEAANAEVLAALAEIGDAVAALAGEE